MEPFKRTQKLSKYFWNLPIPPEPPQPGSSLPNTSRTSGTPSLQNTFQYIWNPACTGVPTTIQPRFPIRCCSSTCDTPPAMKNSTGCSGSPGHTTTRVPSFTKSRRCFPAPKREPLSAFCLLQLPSGQTLEIAHLQNM